MFKKGTPQKAIDERIQEVIDQGGVITQRFTSVILVRVASLILRAFFEVSATAGFYG